MGHRFNPKHIEKLDNPERRKVLPPDEILKWLDVKGSCCGRCWLRFGVFHDSASPADG